MHKISFKYLYVKICRSNYGIWDNIIFSKHQYKVMVGLRYQNIQLWSGKVSLGGKKMSLSSSQEFLKDTTSIIYLKSIASIWNSYIHMNISLSLRTHVPRHAHIWRVMEQNATERILWLASYPLPQNKEKGKTKKAIPFKSRGPLKGHKWREKA